jgi:hypothetical protein
MVAFRPVDPFAVKRTVPLNWFTAVIVIIELVGLPTRMVTPVGAKIVKSGRGVVAAE